jgi:hypothetical protein
MRRATGAEGAGSGRDASRLVHRGMRRSYLGASRVVKPAGIAFRIAVFVVKVSRDARLLRFLDKNLLSLK